MDLVYLLGIGPIVSCLFEYLRTGDKLNLLNVSKTVRGLLDTNPSTWQSLDFSSRSKDVVMYYLRNDTVTRALHELILDCTDINEMSIVVILKRCPQIQYLGIGGTMELLDGVLASIIATRRNGHAKRLRYVGLLGAPHFKATGINVLAASVVRDLTMLGIDTDLRNCSQDHAFTPVPTEQWHLCVANPVTCTACKQETRGCYPCLNGRTCRGCFKFWCFDCENPITRVCYECGHSCQSCKQGIYVKCVECSSMFCKLHRDDLPMTKTTGRTTGLESAQKDTDWCDWCIQGRCQGFGH